MNRKNNKKGFTIVELVIVIAVIGILAAVLIPTFSGVIQSANDSADLQAARNAYTEYFIDHYDANIDYVKLNNKYYDVNNEYDVDTDGKVCGVVLTVAADGTMSHATVHVEAVDTSTGYCNTCKPTE